MKAFSLPSRAFAGTQIGTDIIILKNHQNFYRIFPIILKESRKF
jgi:hypothetical protein